MSTLELQRAMFDKITIGIFNVILLPSLSATIIFINREFFKITLDFFNFICDDDGSNDNDDDNDTLN